MSLSQCGWVGWVGEWVGCKGGVYNLPIVHVCKRGGCLCVCVLDGLGGYTLLLNSKSLFPLGPLLL